MGARKGQTRLVNTKKWRGGFPGTHGGEATAVLLQIVRDLCRLKLGGDPEIAEKENHRGENDVMQPSGRKHLRDLPRGRTVWKRPAHDLIWKQQECPGEDDRHDTGIIHFQRHELRIAT